MSTSFEHILDKEWEGKSAKEVAAAGLDVLQGITEERAQKIAESLGGKTVADLATNKYVLWAQAIKTLADFEK